MKEQSHGFGLIPSPYDSRDYGLIMRGNWGSDVQDEFSLGTLEIKDQGSQQTCAAHVMSEIIEYHNFKQNGSYSKFSTDFVYGSREPDEFLNEGMYLRDALKIINKKGDVLYSDLPGNTDVLTATKKVSSHPELLEKALPNRITSYYKINSINELKFAIQNHGPVAAGMYWYNHSTLKNGIYTYKHGDGYIGHAVMIVGWNEKGFIVQNSWGRRWGNQGTFIIPFENLFEEVLFEAYGVTDDINEVKVTSKKLDWYYRIINFIVNFFKRKIML